MSAMNAVLVLLAIIHIGYAKVVEFKGMTTKELVDLQRSSLKECTEKLNVDEDLIEVYSSAKEGVPDSKDFKKLATCYGEKMGLVADKKINWDRLRLCVEVFHQDDKDYIKKALLVVEDCQKNEAAGMDVEGLSYYLTKCVKDGYTKNNIDW